MKNRPLTRKEIRQFNRAMPWVILLGCILIALSTCSCGGPESLTQPNSNDRVIVGVTKNGKAYKVVNCYGRPEASIKADTIDYNRIGDRLICEFR